MYLTFLALVVAVYSILSQTQKSALAIFFPVRWFLITIGVSFLISLMPYGFVFGGHDLCNKWTHLLELLAFLPPFGIVIGGFIIFYRAKLNNKNFEKFNNFVKTSLRENSFDEFNRIVLKNKEHIHELPKETLILMYDSRIVSNLLKANTWFPLELLANKKLLENLGHHGIDTTIREILKLDSSPLHELVYNSYGGKEPTYYSDEFRKLNELTLLDPEWYTKTRADYPLQIVAWETIHSGKLDDLYNINGRSYELSQGRSLRANCLIYLSLKLQVLAIRQGIEKDFEADYYISNLWQLLQLILQHSKYDPMVWENKLANSEAPTPYAYLIKEICEDFEALSRECITESFKKKRPLRRIADDLAQGWAICIREISSVKLIPYLNSDAIGGHMSGQSYPCFNENFQHQLIREYLEFLLKLKFDPYQILFSNDKHDLTDATDLFTNKLQECLRFNSYEDMFKNSLVSVADKIDYTRYTGGNEWLNFIISKPRNEYKGKTNV